jgi:hypothetical protein
VCTIFLPTTAKRGSHGWLQRASRAVLGLGIATVYGVTVASAGSPEKSAGRAALSSMVLVDMGVTGGGTRGTGGTVAMMGVAGGAALCLGGLGCRGVGAEGACGTGVEGCFSSSLVSSLWSPKVCLSAWL